MLHGDVYEIFKRSFNFGEINTWWQNGYNSIRVRYEDYSEVVFTYTTALDWKLETVVSFMKTMNKNTKNGGIYDELRKC